jgi:hypothetical protein
MTEEIEAPTEQLHEAMHEEVHKSGGEREHHGPKWIGRAALTSALVAVFAAVSSLLAGHHANEAMLEEMKATDNWALYQAKGIKGNVLQSKLELLEAFGKPGRPDDLAKLDEYKKEQKELEDKGHELERASEEHMAHHTVLARTVTVFQVAIAMAAIAVLSNRKALWYLSMGLGVLGLASFVQGLV